MKKVVIIGSGNVAHLIGKTLLKKQFSILQVYSKTKKNTITLAKKLKAKPVFTINDIDLTADIYFLAVSDDQVKNVADTLNFGSKLVVHTSGTVSLEVLKKCSKNIGVFYPLQTIKKNDSIDFKSIPVLIESNSDKMLNQLKSLAKKLGAKSYHYNSVQRKKIHLAAVVVSNFSNHLYHLAYDYLQHEKLPFTILHPLIEQSVKNLSSQSAYNNQTGPARRGDKKTINNHLDLLNKNKQLKKVYQLLSDSIEQTYTEKKTIKNRKQ